MHLNGENDTMPFNGGNIAEMGNWIEDYLYVLCPVFHVYSRSHVSDYRTTGALVIFRHLYNCHFKFTLA